MLSELILKHYPNAEITMLDFSPEMLQSASMYFEEYKLMMIMLNTLLEIL